MQEIKHKEEDSGTFETVHYRQKKLGAPSTKQGGFWCN